MSSNTLPKAKQEAILRHLRTMHGHVAAEIAVMEVQDKGGSLDCLRLIDEEATAIRSILNDDDDQW